MKIGIIGGGVTGIAEAIFLARKGHQVTLYEKQKILGGLAAWFNLAGRDIERYYHFIMTCDTHYIDLLHDLGVGDKLNWVETTTAFFADDKIYPFSEPLDILLRFKPLNFFERFRLCATLGYMVKLTNDWRPFEKRKACEWLPKYAGRRAWEVIWEPMLNMKFGTHTDEMSMAWLWARLNMVNQYTDPNEKSEKRAWLKGSSRTFIEAAEKELNRLGVTIHKGVLVDRVEVEDNKATGIVLDGELEKFDHVIFSASSVALPKLMPEWTKDDPYFQKIYAQKYYGVTCLVAALDRPFNDYFWTYVSDPRVPFVGVVNYSSFTSWEGQEGHHVIYIPWYSETDEEPYTTPKEKVIDDAIEGLKVMNPEFDRSWIREVVVGRDPYTSMMCAGEYSKQLVGLKTPIENFTFANLSQIYPQDRGISVGIKLAKYAVKSLETGEDIEMDFSPKTSMEDV